MSNLDLQKLTDEQIAQIRAILNAENIKTTSEETINNGADENNNDKPLEDLFERDAKGNIKQSNYNCQLVLKHDPLFAGAIRYNEFSDKIDICRPLGWKRYGTAYCDNDLNHIITYIESIYGLKVDKHISRAVSVVASDNSYHPIREKLLSLSWDGQSRLPDALHHFLGVEKTELSIASLKVFMLGAVARVFNPGCKFELMLCLVGGQGAGKSTFLRFLAMEDRYFTDDLKKLDDDRVFQRLQGHWIVEMPEMLAILNAKVVEETKSFISRQSDNYRTPYDTVAVDHPRQCVFAGTSNKTQFLPMDKSGNRRFLPIEVHMEDAECHILDDEAASRAYIEQLWAEIMEIYKSGKYSLTLPKELFGDLLRAQDRHSPEDPMETAIRNFLDDHVPQYVCVKMLYKEALDHMSYENPAQWESNAIADIMDQKMKDYKKISTHRFPAYGTQKAWVLVKEPEFKDIPAGMESEVPFLQEELECCKPINP
ncbi:MAG: virulence-associated protein E [Oribacterium sp.]|nr:virulence-associated protein E [Oribacterium sp.]